MSNAWRSAPVTIFTCMCLFAGGCIPSLEGNEPREPTKEIPNSFVPATSNANSTAAQPSTTTQMVWRDFFDSAELEALIETALEKNQELNIELQEIIIARTEVSARRGAYLPKFEIGAGAGLERVGKNTSQGVGDDAHRLPENLGDFTFGLQGSWEIDIWGKLRNAVKSADLRYLASIESRNFMVTQIVAEIARSYYELVAIDNLLDVLKRNLQVLQTALEIVKLEKQAARVTELAVQRFEAEVLKNSSRLYDLEQQKIQTENRINFLVGRYPQPVIRKAQKLNEALPHVTTGLPSDLLQNRPDIRQAELELAASKLDVQVAKAEFYPALSLETGVGYRAFNIKHLVATPDSLVYNLAGNMVAPLLNRRAIEAEYRSANARQIQAVLNYERTVLQAFTDVANQLAMIENLEKGYNLQMQQVEALARSSEISKVLFQSARADYMEVLLTQRDLLDAQMDLIETRKRQWLAVVDLYKALGGGWRGNASKAVLAHTE